MIRKFDGSCSYTIGHHKKNITGSFQPNALVTRCNCNLIVETFRHLNSQARDIPFRKATSGLLVLYGLREVVRLATGLPFADKRKRKRDFFRLSEMIFCTLGTDTSRTAVDKELIDSHMPLTCNSGI